MHFWILRFEAEGIWINLSRISGWIFIKSFLFSSSFLLRAILESCMSFLHASFLKNPKHSPHEVSIRIVTIRKFREILKKLRYFLHKIPNVLDSEFFILWDREESHLLLQNSLFMSLVNFEKHWTYQFLFG